MNGLEKEIGDFNLGLAPISSTAQQTDLGLSDLPRKSFQDIAKVSGTSRYVPSFPRVIHGTYFWDWSSYARDGPVEVIWDITGIIHETVKLLPETNSYEVKKV